RFSLSGEYLYSLIPKGYRTQVGGELLKDPVGQVSYHGFYIDAGWFLTKGDSRRYNKKLGTWDRTVPLENAWLMKGPDGRVSAGRGAIQLLARFSYLDLESGVPVLTPSAGARAGVEQDVTLGIAWYLNPQSNIQINYVRTHINSVLSTASGN